MALQIRFYRTGNVAVETQARRLVAVGDPRTGRVLFRSPGASSGEIDEARRLVRRYAR